MPTATVFTNEIPHSIFIMDHHNAALLMACIRSLLTLDEIAFISYTYDNKSPAVRFDRLTLALDLDDGDRHVSYTVE